MGKHSTPWPNCPARSLSQWRLTCKGGRRFYSTVGDWVHFSLCPSHGSWVFQANYSSILNDQEEATSPGLWHSSSSTIFCVSKQSQLSTLKGTDRNPVSPGQRAVLKLLYVPFDLKLAFNVTFLYSPFSSSNTYELQWHVLTSRW